jgi:hypothetical protein
MNSSQSLLLRTEVCTIAGVHSPVTSKQTPRNYVPALSLCLVVRRGFGRGNEVDIEKIVDYTQEECKKNVARHGGNDKREQKGKRKIKHTFYGVRTKDPTAQGLGADL